MQALQQGKLHRRRIGHGLTELAEAVFDPPAMRRFGVGYRANLEGKNLNLQLGYSHDIKYPIPEGIAIKVGEKQTTIAITGADKQKVGQVAAEIRGYRSPEPYKGKGVRYLGERVVLKEAKKK